MRRATPHLLLLILILCLGLPRPVAAQLEVTAGAARIGLGGRLHVQYARSSDDVNAMDDVLIRRARLRLDIRITDALDGRVENDFAPQGGLTDAWMRVSFAPWLRLSGGQLKRAFSTFELHSSTDLPVIERDGRVEGVGACPGVGSVCTFSRFAERLLYDDRDLGLRLEGEAGPVSWLATLTNGDGRSVPDSNDRKSHSVRVEVAALPELRVAGFLGRHDYTNAFGDADADAVGLDLEWGDFRAGPHALVGVMTGDNWLVGPGSQFTAAQGLFSWYLPLGEGGRFAGVEPMLRVSWASTQDIADVDREAMLVTPGVSLYVAGKNWIGVNLDRYDPDFQPTRRSLKVQWFMFF